MVSTKIGFLLILSFFSIVFIQSGLDKVFDHKGNLSFLRDLLGKFFSQSLITLAFISVTVLELFSGFLCLAGVFYTLFYDSSLIGLVGLIVGSVALLVLLFGQRVSKNYEGAKTITIYFILSIIGVLLA
jgi:uncharacterized membrane protein YphA (DoxX/SURF4 family)|tara:strand:+ start:422 stop:808 length:387 start_codon:yes stop_codon:yes gene_type:complete